MKLKQAPVNILSTDNIKSKKSVLKGFKVLLKSFDFLFNSIDSQIIDGEEDFKLCDIETFWKIQQAVNRGSLDDRLYAEALYFCEHFDANTTLVEIRDNLRSKYQILKHNINTQLSKLRCFKIGNVCIKFIKLIRCFYNYPTNDADAIGSVNPVIQTLTYRNYLQQHEKTRKRIAYTGFSGNTKLFG